MTRPERDRRVVGRAPRVIARSRPQPAHVGLGLAAAAAAMVATLLFGAAASAQSEASAPGEGRNLALTIVDSKSPFFRTGPATVVSRHPGAYVRRASIAGDSDQQLLVANISDGEVLDSQGQALADIDLLAEVGDTATVWGEVVRQTQPLTADETPRVGFILGLYGGRDLLVRDESVTAATAALQEIDEVILLARVRGGADLVAMYAIDPMDLAAGVRVAEAIQAAMAASEVEIELEGIGIPLARAGG